MALYHIYIYTAALGGHAVTSLATPKGPLVAPRCQYNTVCTRSHNAVLLTGRRHLFFEKFDYC